MPNADLGRVFACVGVSVVLGFFGIGEVLTAGFGTGETLALGVVFEVAVNDFATGSFRTETAGEALAAGFVAVGLSF